MVASKGSLDEYKAIVTVLDRNKMAMKWGKRGKIIQSEIEWLGFKISGDGEGPLVGKADAIKILPTSNKISEL